MTAPLVSAVMMTYNRPTFVRQAIKLFLNQTWPRKELLIIDDGPEGQVPTGLPPEIRHIRCPRLWITHKRAIGFAEARGEFVAGFDDDDYHGPRRLEVQAKAILSGKLDACGFPLEFLVTIPDLYFRQWREIWPGQFLDSTVMIRHDLLMRLPREAPDACLWPSPREIRNAGGRADALQNGGHWVYVVHPHSVWGSSLELAKKTQPISAPAFVPAEMRRFWTNPALIAEGGGGTWDAVRGKR